MLDLATDAVVVTKVQVSGLANAVVAGKKASVLGLVKSVVVN